MLFNYLKIALRNIQRDFGYSLINIFGLALGIACSLLITLGVWDELTYDRQLPQGDRLSQVWVHATIDGQINSFQAVPYPVYRSLREEDSRIKNTAIAAWPGESLLTAGNQRINKRSMYASEEFLEMFRFPLLHGLPDQVLDLPESIVLDESTAKVLFGDADPIGQTVRVDNAHDLRVTGILRDLPRNSSFDFQCLLPHKILERQDWVKRSINTWGNYSFQVFA